MKEIKIIKEHLIRIWIRIIKTHLNQLYLKFSTLLFQLAYLANIKLSQFRGGFLEG